MPDKRVIRVFLASPSDLLIERRAFKQQIELLNLGFGDGAYVRYDPLGWEDALASTGHRAQSVINQDIDACDVFILAMHRRWGQEAPDAKPYTSYTEEEFHRALDRWKRSKAPEVFVFLKNIETDSMADPGPQLERVLAFRKVLEQSGIVLYKTFGDDKEFKSLVDCHLRAYAKGELPRPDGQRDSIVLPIECVQRVEQAEAEAKRSAERAEANHNQLIAEQARANELALALAGRAAKAALEGRIEEARQDFAIATSAATNTKILYLAFEFYLRTGDLSAAEAQIQRWLALCGPDKQTGSTANAYGNLGVIYQARGDLGQAEKMHRRSLETYEKLGRSNGAAAAYGNIGVICEMRGELDQAETMFRKSLEIYEELGQLEGIAQTYGNLGLIHQTRGELDEAEKLLRKSLQINEKLGRIEGVAVSYSHLGSIYQTRGDLGQAETMHRKALEIEEKLGRPEGMASDYDNLGLIFQQRGDLDEAEKMHRKALAINELFGRVVGISESYGNLGLIYQKRGDLDQAEKMHRKSLEISERLGTLERVATQQGNLGAIYLLRGDRDRAWQMFRNSLEISERVGDIEVMAAQYANLGSVAVEWRRFAEARDHWSKSVDLYQKIGMHHLVKKVQGWFDALPPPETPT